MQYIAVEMYWGGSIVGMVVSRSSLKPRSARSFLDTSSPTFCRHSNSLTMACLSEFFKWDRRVDCELPLVIVRLICVSLQALIHPSTRIRFAKFSIYTAVSRPRGNSCALFTVAARVYSVRSAAPHQLTLCGSWCYSTRIINSSMHDWKKGPLILVFNKSNWVHPLN